MEAKRGKGMEREEIIELVESLCDGKCNVIHVLSATSMSVYFEINNQYASTRFRISDHINKYCKMIQFVLQGKKDCAKITRFVLKRIKVLKTKSIYVLLDAIKKPQSIDDEPVEAAI